MSHVKIKRIEVLTHLPSTDKVNLFLDAPPAFLDMGYEATAIVDVQKGHGVGWALETAKMRILEINCTTGEKTWRSPEDPQ